MRLTNNMGRVPPESFLGKIPPMPKPSIKGSASSRFTHAQIKAIAIPIILLGIGALFFYLFQAYNRKSTSTLEKKTNLTQKKPEKPSNPDNKINTSPLSDSCLKTESHQYAPIQGLTYEEKRSPSSLLFQYGSIETATSVSIKAQDMFHACKAPLERGEKQVLINAANRHLQGGGGIDGLIQQHGGEKYKEAHRAILPYLQSNPDIEKTLLQGGYPEGWAISIPSGDLKDFHNVEKVIVVSGPNIESRSVVTSEEEQKLYNCYYNALEVANKIEDVTRVIFPCISTGIFGFPLDKASPIFTSAIFHFLQDNSSTKIREISIHVLEKKDLVSFAVDTFANNSQSEE